MARDLLLDTLPSPMQDQYSTKLFTLLRSMNLERYWSTFERNEVIVPHAIRQTFDVRCLYLDWLLHISFYDGSRFDTNRYWSLRSSSLKPSELVVVCNRRLQVESKHLRRSIVITFNPVDHAMAGTTRYWSSFTPKNSPTFDINIRQSSRTSFTTIAFAFLSVYLIV